MMNTIIDDESSNTLDIVEKKDRAKEILEGIDWFLIERELKRLNGND